MGFPQTFSDTTYIYVRFEVFMVVMIQVKVFWVVTLCHVAVGGYQYFKYYYRYGTINLFVIHYEVKIIC